MRYSGIPGIGDRTGVTLPQPCDCTVFWYDVFVQVAGGGQANAGTGPEMADAERFAAAIAHELGVPWGGLKL